MTAGRTAAAAVRSQIAVFAKRVGDVMQSDVATVSSGTPIAAAVATMAAHRLTSLVLVDSNGSIDGILTERDVARRAAFSAVGAEPVRTFATRPVHTTTVDDYLYRAIARMRRLDLRHLPVVDHGGRPIGMVNLIDGFAVAAEQMLRQLDRLTGEATLDGMAEVKAAEAGIAADLLADNLPAPDIMALITDVNRDLHRQVLDNAVRALADQGLGSPPVPVTALVMGSGGRGENFLAPDQDNGFILGDYPDAEHGRIDPYAIALAERFNADLDRIGFPFCRGYVMARNPLWRKTATQWREQLRLWVGRGTPASILFADIFFDFCAVAGPPGPADTLRRTIVEVLRGNPRFLALMCPEDLGRGGAVGLFGRLVTESGSPDPRRTDLKLRGLMPLVGSVRLRALEHGVAETGTMARLSALAAGGALGRDEADELTHAFEVLAHMVLRQQLDDARTGLPVGNLVDTKVLLRRERRVLVDSLRSVARFGRDTRAHFIGVMF